MIFALSEERISEVENLLKSLETNDHDIIKSLLSKRGSSVKNTWNSISFNDHMKQEIPSDENEIKICVVENNLLLKKLDYIIKEIGELPESPGKQSFVRKIYPEEMTDFFETYFDTASMYRKHKESKDLVEKLDNFFSSMAKKKTKIMEKFVSILDVQFKDTVELGLIVVNKVIECLNLLRDFPIGGDKEKLKILCKNEFFNSNYDILLQETTPKKVLEANFFKHYKSIVNKVTKQMKFKSTIVMIVDNFVSQYQRISKNKFNIMKELNYLYISKIAGGVSKIYKIKRDKGGKFDNLFFTIPKIREKIFIRNVPFKENLTINTISKRNNVYLISVLYKSRFKRTKHLQTPSVLSIDLGITTVFNIFRLEVIMGTGKAVGFAKKIGGDIFFNRLSNIFKEITVKQSSCKMMCDILKKITEVKIVPKKLNEKIPTYLGEEILSKIGKSFERFKEKNFNWDDKDIVEQYVVNLINHHTNIESMGIIEFVHCLSVWRYFQKMMNNRKSVYHYREIKKVDNLDFYLKNWENIERQFAKIDEFVNGLLSKISISTSYNNLIENLRIKVEKDSSLKIENLWRKIVNYRRGFYRTKLRKYFDSVLSSGSNIVLVILGDFDITSFLMKTSSFNGSKFLRKKGRLLSLGVAVSELKWICKKRGIVLFKSPESYSSCLNPTTGSTMKIGGTRIIKMNGEKYDRDLKAAILILIFGVFLELWPVYKDSLIELIGREERELVSQNVNRAFQGVVTNVAKRKLKRWKMKERKWKKREKRRGR